MNSATIAKYAALLTIGLWAAKAVAIGVAGGLDRSPMETPLFLAGLLSCLVAVGALALALTARRSIPVRVGAVVAGVIAAIAVTFALGAVVELLAASDHWVWSELNLWLLAVIVLALVWSSGARLGRPAAQPHA